MTKLTNEQRRAVIITAGLRIVADTGLWAIAHSTVAKRCVVPTSAATVKHYFPTKADLWAILIEADKTGKAATEAEELGCGPSRSD
jgi:DNA-binding transcriptional regulator YbjK